METSTTMKAPLLEKQTKRRDYTKIWASLLIVTALAGIFLIISSETFGEEEFAVGQSSYDGRILRAGDDDFVLGMDGSFDEEYESEIGVPYARTTADEAKHKSGKRSKACTKDLKWRTGTNAWKPAQIITMPNVLNWKIELTENKSDRNLCSYDVSECSSTSRSTTCTGALIANYKSSDCSFQGGVFELKIGETALAKCTEPTPYPYFYAVEKNFVGKVVEDTCGSKTCKLTEGENPKMKVCRRHKWGEGIGASMFNWNKDTCRGSAFCQDLKATNELECVSPTDERSKWKTDDCVNDGFCGDKKTPAHFPGPWQPVEEVSPDFTGVERFFNDAPAKYGFPELSASLSIVEKDYLYCALMVKPTDSVYGYCYSPVPSKAGRGYSPWRMWKDPKKKITKKDNRDAWKKVFRDGGFLQFQKDHEWKNFAFQQSVFAEKKIRDHPRKMGTMKALYKLDTGNVVAKWKRYDLSRGYLHFRKDYWGFDNPGVPKHDKDPIMIRMSFTFTNRASMEDALQAVADAVMKIQPIEELSDICLFKMSPFASGKNDHVIMTFCPYYDTQAEVDAQKEEVRRGTAKGKESLNPKLFTKEQLRSDIEKICEILKPFHDAGKLSDYGGPFQTALEGCPYITFSTYWGRSSGSNLAQAVTQHREEYAQTLTNMATLPAKYSGWSAIPAGNSKAVKEQKNVYGMALFVDAWVYCNGPSSKLPWNWKYPSVTPDQEWACSYNGNRNCKAHARRNTKFTEKCVIPYLNSLTSQAGRG